MEKRSRRSKHVLRPCVEPRLAPLQPTEPPPRAMPPAALPAPMPVEVVEVIEVVEVEGEEGEEGEEVVEEIVEVTDDEASEGHEEPHSEPPEPPEPDDPMDDYLPAPAPAPAPAPEAAALAPSPPPRKLMRQVISRHRWMPRTITDEVANSVLAACKQADEDATITYVACETDSHVIRIRSGLGTSVSALQRALRAAMPLSNVRTYESALDGTLQAQVEVPSKYEEYSKARDLAREGRPLKFLYGVSVLLFVIGMTLWAVQLSDHAARMPVEAPALDAQAEAGVIR
jgi:hypothetical protein